MTSENKAPNRTADQALDDIVQEADEYYNYLKERRVRDTRLDVIAVTLSFWFAAFASIGLVSLVLYGEHIYYIVTAFVIAVVIGALSGALTYAFRRRQGFKFAELGTLLAKMKQGSSSSEDALRLTDEMHRAALEVRKRKVNSAFEYGLVGFALVAIIGLNAGIGALAGVIVYLYFRYEALRDYENAETRYEDSKRALLSSL